MSASVIMATYNNEHEIGLAVASILLQDYEDYELVIVNDASTDATPEIVERFAAQDDRVIVLHNERNLGRAMSRNRAIKTARAELIAILDADDIAMPYRLSRQVAYMNTHPEIGMLGGWSIRINALNQPLDLLIGPTQDIDIRHRLQRLRMPFTHSTVMFRRKAAIAAGLYDPRFIRSQDSHFCRRVIQHTKAAALPELLLLYRLNTAEQSVLLRERARWSVLSGWDSLKQSPNALGFLNLTRFFLLSRLPTPALNLFSGMKRRRIIPKAEQSTEALEWIEKLTDTRRWQRGSRCKKTTALGVPE